MLAEYVLWEDVVAAYLEKGVRQNVTLDCPHLRKENAVESYGCKGSFKINKQQGTKNKKNKSE